MVIIIMPVWESWATVGREKKPVQVWVITILILVWTLVRILQMQCKCMSALTLGQCFWFSHLFISSSFEQILIESLEQ
jgi:hypothetical protein